MKKSKSREIAKATFLLFTMYLFQIITTLIRIYIYFLDFAKTFSSGVTELVLPKLL